MSKKILILEPYLDLLGGSERMVFEVARALAQEGWEIHVGYERDGIWGKRYQPFAAAFHQIRLPILTFRQPWEMIGACLKLLYLLKKLEIQTLFSSWHGHLLLAGILERFCGIRSCFHLGLMGNMANTVSGRWAVRQISAGVAPSEQTAESWRWIGWSSSTIHVVPNWIDWEDYRDLPSKEQARKMLGIGTAAPARRGLGASSAGEREGAGGRELKVVAYVGRLVEEKGIEVLLEAWNQGFAQDEDAVLLVAGTGKPEYEAKLKAKAAKNVKFLGGLEDTKPVYRASDLTVVPSLWEEPFGLVPLEAAACGSFLLTSDRGNLPKLVGEKNKAAFYPAKKPKILSEKIYKILFNKGKQWQQKLRIHLEKKYGLENCQKYIKIISFLQKRPS